MGKNMSCLFDTNILIYYFNGSLPSKAKKAISEMLRKGFNISVISKMEFLGFDQFGAKEKDLAAHFLAFSKVIPLNDVIVNKVIQIKQAGKIKLPDAIIGATAFCSNLQLVTHNCKDFTGINIKLYDPFSNK